jgi:hypothetical protein
MRRIVVVFGFLLFAVVVIGVGMLSQQWARAQGGRGGGPSPELQAAMAR